MIRIDLLKHTGVLTPNVYNQVYSVHGSMMVWLVIIPFVSGAFGNFVMPLQIGARDVAFPVGSTWPRSGCSRRPA